MNIALLGYGKMGQEIEKIALANGHQIVLKIFFENAHELTIANLQKADVAIEFSTPATAKYHIERCLEAGVPIVVGTTGWYEHLPTLSQAIAAQNGSLLYSTNFSIGVNLFFYLNKKLATLMNNFPSYEVSIEEIHHTQKLDSPSGTAITTAEDILSNLERKREWKNKSPQSGNISLTANDLLITSVRTENVPGTHTVSYQSDIDSIELKHTAFNRKGFAHGAVTAAEWLQAGKKGIFTMSDVLATTFNKL